ncbi:DNA oxidative demethylase AlkB [Bordetella genomosp. 9]|uniref:Alpha-ketoglutarate-dependent dioxygenase AlkB n=1 Tax=Bordetella genomosp. 9 TaxID=1416803 RepID=A0A1W6Z0J1_9BORD|nr:DNA oxidative demethylase AlkB [Bordetella genomosp. 9]ARP86860.1 alpha-ketoglutarate-dependent dioxygenase AlkB [Bordetella genomosp. 9]ARP90846.1 alpha-ketoglutarate-dependent dioxygenase AlkB [Bordetella genomosp. 9]
MAYPSLPGASGDLFGAPDEEAPWDEPIAPGAVLLRRYACGRAPALLAAVKAIAAAAPFRHLETPGGQRMSVAMTNCGTQGWISDRRGYRYGAEDPLSGRPWPAMPDVFIDLAREAAARAGYADFAPQACLINLYRPGARLSLHQDRDELDLRAPIVSISLGLPAVFLFGGLQRNDRPRRFTVQHGDIAVWGGPSRLAFHGVAPLRDGTHPATGPSRVNLTFRKTA